MPTLRNRVLFGAAYYHEYQPSPRLDTDLDLMTEAGFSVIRVGESVWTTWEPEDGRFDLDWLAPILDGAHQRGIGVILGTPTYAVPPWLARRYPEIAGETATGQRMPWGGRQEVDYTHPAFKFYAERVIRKIVSHYADHPAVIGYQVDNEPGMLLFHNEGVFQRFVDELRLRYQTVDALNEAWGLVYWSHKLSTWADLWRPDGNWQPQYDLAWRTFQAKLTTEFIGWQADIVREYARDDQFVTTCIAYDRPTVDDANLTRDLDVTAGNPYYAMQDALAVPSTARSSAGLDHLRSMEPVPLRGPDVRLQTGAVPDHRDQRRRDRRIRDQLPRLRRAVAAGGVGLRRPRCRDDRVLALAHQPLRHRDLLGRDPAPRPAAGTGVRASSAGSAPSSSGRVAGCRPSPGRPHRLALLGAVEVGTRVPGDLSPARREAIASPHEVDQRSYHRIFEAFYRGTFDAGGAGAAASTTSISSGRTVRGCWTRPTVADELPVLVVAGLLVADDALLTWLRDYAAAGGHLVLGPRTAYGDEEGRARLEVKPAHLAEPPASATRSSPTSATRCRSSPRPTAISAVGRGGGHRLGGRTDQRGRQGDRRLRPPALRPVPRRGVHRARSRAGSPRSARCPTRPSPPTSSAGSPPSRSRAGGSCGVSDRAFGHQRRRRADPRRAQLELDRLEVILPTPMTDILTDESADHLTELELGSWDVRVLAE